MVEIGGTAILWHIMRYYHHFGFKDFSITLGYKADFVKRWFAERRAMHTTSRSISPTGEVRPHGESNLPDWTVDLDRHGAAHRHRWPHQAAASLIGTDERTFMVTWGDGVSNVDLHKLLAFHKAHGKICTLTAVRPPARFGHLDFDGDQIVNLDEQADRRGLDQRRVLRDEVRGVRAASRATTSCSSEPLSNLAKDGQLMAFRHYDFWQCMDTVRDRKRLEELWATDTPWKAWND